MKEHTSKIVNYFDLFIAVHSWVEDEIRSSLIVCLSIPILYNTVIYLPVTTTRVTVLSVCSQNIYVPAYIILCKLHNKHGGRSAAPDGIYLFFDLGAVSPKYFAIFYHAHAQRVLLYNTLLMQSITSV